MNFVPRSSTLWFRFPTSWVSFSWWSQDSEIRVPASSLQRERNLLPKQRNVRFCLWFVFFLQLGIVTQLKGLLWQVHQKLIKNLAPALLEVINWWI
jgi:hypothetical protein